jgi:hypothetical protein
MTRWTFFGRILPERIPVRSESLNFTSEAPNLGFRYQITIRIADGQFVVPVVIETGPDDVNTLKNLAEADIRKCVDYLGYRNGLSFDVEIISAACDDGRVVVFGIAIPALKESRIGNDQIFEISGFKSFLYDTTAEMVLADFREAMRNPVGTGFFCYRAIEAMMQGMKADPNDKDDAWAWGELRQRLQIDRSAIDAIKAHADYPRHGKLSWITDADRANLFRATDKIIFRYLTYLERGKTGLPSSEFSLLVS